MGDDERLQSEFNDSIGYLNRLNSLFYLADDSAMNLDVYGWFHSLMALERELSTEMNEAELKQFEILQKEVNSMISNYLTEKSRNMNSSVSAELYNKLHKFELDLRSIVKSAGLQNKMKEDASHALK